MASLEEVGTNVVDQSSTKDSDDEERGQTERENEIHSVTGLKIHGQVDHEGVGRGSLEVSGKREVDYHTSHMEDSIPKNPKLVIPIMVDLELSITKEVVMQRRINGLNFQE